MPNSFFKPTTMDCLPKKVLFLGFDGTLAGPARKKNGDYDVQPDGLLQVTHLDLEKIKNLVLLAIDQDVPLHIISGRTETAQNIKLLNQFIDSVGGFHSGIGGFKKDSIYFTNQYVSDGNTSRPVETASKLNIIQNIHITKYSYLSNLAFLFVDNVQDNLDHVTTLGYPTLLADDRDLRHFESIELFLTTPLEEMINKFTEEPSVSMH